MEKRNDGIMALVCAMSTHFYCAFNGMDRKKLQEIGADLAKRAAGIKCDTGNRVTIRAYTDISFSEKELREMIVDMAAIRISIERARSRTREENSMEPYCYDAEFWGAADCTNTACPYHVEDGPMKCDAAAGCPGREETEVDGHA